MNPGSYQNMPGPGMGSGVQPHGGPQKPDRGQQSIQQYIMQVLQQQQRLQGWQSTMSLQQRVYNVFQLISSIRLIKPELDNAQSLSIGINFEFKVFVNSQDKDSYDRACKAKLTEIRETRTRQANNLQQQMQNQQQMNIQQSQMQIQNMTPNPNQPQYPFNPNANPQLQQPMQTSGVPLSAMSMQQRMMQQQQQQQQQHQQQQHQQQQHQQHQQQQQQYMIAAPNMGMPQMSQVTSQQIPQNQGPLLTPEENHMILQMAHTLARNTPRDQLDVIRQNLQNMSMEQRQQFAMQNIDPVEYFFRSRALKKFMEQRSRTASLRVNPDVLTSGGAVTSRPPSQNSMPIQPQQNGPPITLQMVDSSLAGNMDHILGQQQDAMRLQEAGQVVVPASNPTGMVDQPRVGNRPTPQPHAQLGGNRVTPNLGQIPQPQPSYWSTPPMQQPSMPHLPGFPQSLSYGNMPTQPLQDQAEALGHHVGRVSQPNPNMPNFGNGAKPSPQTSNVWPARAPAQPNQPKDHNAAATPKAPQPPQSQGAPLDVPGGSQPRPRPMQNMQEQLQQHLASLPENQRQTFMKKLQQRMAQQKAAEAAASQAHNNQGGSEATAMADQPSRDVSGQSLTHDISGAHQPVGSQQLPSAAAVGPHTTQPQRPQQRPRNAAQQANITLTEEQTHQMDQRDFPMAILNNGVAISQLPQNIKTWGQLKAWITQNSSLPPGVLIKIKGLQALQYQTLAKHREQAQQSSQVSALNPPGAIRPSVPTASMLPSRVGQTPPNGFDAQQGQQPHPMPPLPQSANQEMRAYRARLPEHLSHLNDEQLALLIKRQRQGPFTYNGNLQRSQFPEGVQPQFQATNHPVYVGQQPLGGQRPPQQAPRSAPISKDASAKSANVNRNRPQTPNQGPSTAKGTKRQNSDDVVEVSNPHGGMHEPNSQLSKPSPATTQSKTNMARHVPDQPSMAAQDPNSMMDAQHRTQNSQGSLAFPFQLSRQDANAKVLLEADRGHMARLDQLTRETQQNTPARQLVPMNPQNRAKMVQKLRDAKDMVQRMEQYLPYFFKIFGDEKTTREMISTRLMLVNQYRDDEFNPKDQFTITFEELNACVEKLNRYFHSVKAKVLQHKGAQQSQGQATNRQLPPQQAPQQMPAEAENQASTEQAQTLSAANLKEHQKAMQVQRQASVQKNSAHGGSRAPAAPTSPQPPFPFGSPHGVPPKYAPRPNEPTQASIYIPPKKKRKSEQTPSAASTPAPVQGAAAFKSPSQAPKNTPPGAPQMSVNPPTIKCPMPGCVVTKEFTSTSEVDQHILEIHELKEPIIEDPLEFCLEQMRFGLGLDENGKSKPLKPIDKAEKGEPEASKMKASASAQGATPMARVSTQTGPSPAPNVLKTPQASTNIKTPTSEIKSAAKDHKDGNPKAVTEKAAATPSDPWAGSLISPEIITAAWSGCAELNRLSASTWSTVQPTLTPPSTLSSGKSEKNSPRISNISETDAVDINLAVDGTGWLPVDWAGGGWDCNMQSLVVDEDMLDMDWETAFGKDDGEDVTGGAAAKKTRCSVDDSEPSREWLRHYVPGSLDK